MQYLPFVSIVHIAYAGRTGPQDTRTRFLSHDMHRPDTEVWRSLDQLPVSLCYRSRKETYPTISLSSNRMFTRLCSIAPYPKSLGRPSPSLDTSAEMDCLSLFSTVTRLREVVPAMMDLASGVKMKSLIWRVLKSHCRLTVPFRSYLFSCARISSKVSSRKRQVCSPWKRLGTRIHLVSTLYS